MSNFNYAKINTVASIASEGTEVQINVREFNTLLKFI